MREYQLRRKQLKRNKKNKTPKALEMDGDTCDAETKSEIKSMWTLIKYLKKAVETVTFAVAKNNMKLSTISKENSRTVLMWLNLIKITPVASTETVGSLISSQK